MRFFLLNCGVGDDVAAVQEIRAHTRGKVLSCVERLDQQDSNVQGSLVCKLVKVLDPIKYTKAGSVLLVLLSDINSKQERVSYFKTKFYNNMAQSMNNAVQDLKINRSDLIVLQKPVVSFKSEEIKGGKDSKIVVEVGLLCDQAIDVWAYDDGFNKTLDLYSLPFIDQLNVKSIKKLINEHSSKESILSYFINLIHFWKNEDQIVNQTLCLFREIHPKGNVGCFFKVSLHRKLAHQFFQALQDKKITPGDVISFTNPVRFKNPGFKSEVFAPGEPYFLQIGCSKDEDIGLCKLEKYLRELYEIPPIETQKLNSVASPQLTNNRGNSSKVISVSNKNTNDLRDNMHLGSQPANKGGNSSSTVLSVSEKNTKDFRVNVLLRNLELAKRRDNSSSTGNKKNTKDFIVNALLRNLELAKRRDNSSSTGNKKNTKYLSVNTLLCLELTKRRDNSSSTVMKKYINDFRGNTHLGPQLAVTTVYPSSKKLKENTSDSSDEPLLIPLTLLKPSKEILNLQNLNLVSGHCFQCCQNMFMYSEILWNAKREPLCPKCYVILKLHMCLEFNGLSSPSGKIVNILLAGEKVEKFLGVGVDDFLENNAIRMLALKILETKYVFGSGYKPHRLNISDVSVCNDM